VQSGAVSVETGAQILGKPRSAISNLERMKAQRKGNINDFEKRAMVESTTCQP